jgi:ketosteroid isomerase-like protein
LENTFPNLCLVAAGGEGYIRSQKSLKIQETRMSTTTEEYNDALNASSTDVVMSLYTKDGVFMPPYSFSAIGSDAVREAYDAVFAALRLTVKFNIAEIVEISPEWAFARTNSAGTTLNHATGKTSVEGNQELFIFKKNSGGKFKIARYSFSTTKPQTE